MYDSDENGVLDKQELMGMIKQLGLQIEDEEVAQIVDACTHLQPRYNDPAGKIDRSSRMLDPSGGPSAPGRRLNGERGAPLRYAPTPHSPQGRLYGFATQKGLDANHDYVIEI